MVDQWNSVVNKNDTVHVVGDVVMKKKNLPVLDDLKGTRILVKGNHDAFKIDDYTPWFKASGVHSNSV